MRMRLLPNWRAVAARAWSVRLIILSSLLSSVAGVLALVDLFDAPRWLIVAAAIGGPLFGGAAALARLVAQDNLPEV